jgi:hypothetical protein
MSKEIKCLALSVVIIFCMGSSIFQRTQEVTIDNSTHAMTTVDYAHHEIHSGDMFTCHFSQTAPTNAGEMTIIAFTTPNTTKYLHCFAIASSTAASTFSIYEVSDLDLDEGTDLAIYNHNRNSSKTSGVLTLETVAETGEATSFTVAQAAGATLSTAIPLYQRFLGAAAAGSDTGGETRSDNEYVLKANTQYAFVVASTTADDNTHNIMLHFYEHTNIEQ